jgi:hypothetical protein
MANVGIDYGMGCTNVDHATGIRYGVISQNEILQAWADSSQPVYGDLSEEEIEFADPCGWEYSGDGYEMVDCLDSDVMILASPFYTFARFCSPCVPGAGNLNDAGDESHGVKTFCVGHDWFDGGKAPYPVYRVDTGELVLP